MRAIKLTAHVGSDHTLHLQLPADVAEGPAEVIVLVPDTPAGFEQDDLQAFLDWLRRQPRQTLSKEEIDRYLAEERDSWGES